MKTAIIFPKEFFSPVLLRKLEKHNPTFVEGKNLELEKIPGLYENEELILSVNPAYMKKRWNCLSLEQIKKMKGLKALCLSTTSYSWVDTKTLTKMGIMVTNAPGKSTNAVAEFNIYMMLALLRKLPLIAKNEWKIDLDNHLCHEASQKTAGIIGLGQIGSRVAQLCAGLEMKVQYWNRSKKDSPYRAVSLSKLLENSDILFNTMATPNETHGMIDKKLLSKMKSGAYLISTSDTSNFDEKFVLEQVAKARLGGYAFESNEKTLFDFEGNVMIFPEQAFYTQETQETTARLITESILSVINGKPVNKVN